MAGRDGARASDYQGILTERAGIDRAHVRRIRDRERNAFVSVRREDLARALAALNGASLAGRVAMAEHSVFDLVPGLAAAKAAR